MIGPRPAAAWLVGVALALTACGTQTLNTDNVEREVKQGIERQANLRDVTVECPDDVEVEAGSKFTCTARSGREEAPVEVTQRDDQGNVRWELKQQ
jgi:hypothetical protein